MPISKDEQYSIYNFGIAEGRDIVDSYLDGDDIIDIVLEGFSSKSAKRIERSGVEDLELAVENFMDGVEDGIKSQLGKELTSYVKWMRDNL